MTMDMVTMNMVPTERFEGNDVVTEDELFRRYGVSLSGHNGCRCEAQSYVGCNGEGRWTEDQLWEMEISQIAGRGKGEATEVAELWVRPREDNAESREVLAEMGWPGSPLTVMDLTYDGLDYRVVVRDDGSVIAAAHKAYALRQIEKERARLVALGCLTRAYAELAQARVAMRQTGLDDGHLLEIARTMAVIEDLKATVRGR